nr:hypothetical protein GCM10020093_065220 [Planobispora longispora]
MPDPLSAVDPDRPLEEFGLSSRDAVAVAGELEALLGRELGPTLVWEYPTINRLARGLAAGAARAAEGTGSGAARGRGTCRPVRRPPRRPYGPPATTSRSRSSASAAACPGPFTARRSSGGCS